MQPRLHKECLGMSTTESSRLGKSDDTWNGPSCRKPNTSTKIYSIPEDNLDLSSKSFDISAHPSMVNSITNVSMQSKKNDKGHETIQSSTTPNPGHHKGK